MVLFFFWHSDGTPNSRRAVCCSVSTAGEARDAGLSHSVIHTSGGPCLAGLKHISPPSTSSYTHTSYCKLLTRFHPFFSPICHALRCEWTLLITEVRATCLEFEHDKEENGVLHRLIRSSVINRLLAHSTLSDVC